MEVRLALDVPATTDAREAVATWLAESVDASVLDHCKLVVSELVTNSVRHSGLPADEQVVVRVGLERDHVRLEVADRGCSGTVARRVPDIVTGGGFGLALVEMISTAWGVERSAREGTVVWAELPRRPDETFDAAGS